MKHARVWGWTAFLVLVCTLIMSAQQQTATVVPALVRFSGVLGDAKGEPLVGTVGLTFAFYQNQQGGSPLWLETQNVQADKTGHYTVMLGATSSSGLPVNLFASGEARWVGVQVQGQPEQPRVLLLSVPYAMKAGDADTLGGLPASAYRTVNSGSGSNGGATANRPQTGNKGVAQPNTISGNQNYVAKFTDTKDDLGNSEIYDTGSVVGIGTTTPGAFVDVRASSRGIHDPEMQVGSSGPNDSNSIKVYNGSDLIDIFLTGIKSGFMPGTSPGDGGWRVDPGHNLFFGDKNLSRMVLAAYGNVGIGTTTPAFTLDVEGTGINTNKAYDLQGQLFAHGSYNNSNAFVGFAGNTTMTGNGNTADGYQALYSNTSGISNTASGYWALTFNTTGSANTAAGQGALFANTTGCCNAAYGDGTLFTNNTGSANTAIGHAAGQTIGGAFMSASNNTFLGASSAASTGTVGNATAVGANTVVTESNTLVLGCVSGVNSCPATVSVGIGTTSPDNLLSVNGTADKPGGGSWGTFSDRRLKKLDGNFGAGLSQILRINPVRYRYKADNAMGIRDQEEHVGLVAQEVQKVIPEAVTENSKGYLLVNNDPVIWTMLNAIKEQQKLIQTQQEQIAQLTSQVKAIQASLKTNGRTGSEIRTVKAQAPMVQQ